MKMVFCFAVTLLIFAMFVSLSSSFALDTPPENMVRVIYFLPNDRQPQPDIDAKLDTLIKNVQQSYAEVMEKQGFGRKTFRLETDGTGKAVVHHIEGQFSDVHYHTDIFLKVQKEIDKHFDLSTNIYLVALDISNESVLCGLASINLAIINAFSGCFNVAVTAHELGHSFGLAHDRRRDAKRTSTTYHADLMVTSYCAAEWLDVHPYFNTSQNISNHNTEIQQIETDLVSSAESIRFRFQITDPDGLHQVQVRFSYWELGACERLRGQSEVYEFNFIPTLYGIYENFRLHVIDVHGNLTVRHFPIDDSLLLPLLNQPVSIPDANLATAIRTALNLGANDAFTQMNLLKLTHLNAHNLQITDLTGLEHATQLQNLDLGGNQISDISPIANLTRLHVLNLSENQIRDITAITNLKNLQYLYLSGNQISDISSIANLLNLEQLNLSGNQIKDITVIANLQNLYYLYLSGNQISDVNPIATSNHLIHLDVSNNAISDFSPLDGVNAAINLVGNPGVPLGGPKIEGPWLWVIVPTAGRSGRDAAASGIDFLAQASGDGITELKVSTGGAKEGASVGGSLWTTGKIPAVSNNINTMVNATGLGTGNIDHHVAYGLIALDAPRKQDTMMFAGSDDAVKVWLNGQLVHNNPVNRGASGYQDFFSATLELGTNILLVAVYEGTGGWSGFFGFAPDAEYTALAPGASEVHPESTDVNSDGVVNILDLVSVASSFGQTGEIRADVNGDSVVNILDLVLVANTFANIPAAPTLKSQTFARLTATEVEGWLTQAQQIALTDPAHLRGIAMLEQLLAALTPKENVLLPNYPNPFNPETWIPYHLAHDADVTLTIYDIEGMVVRRLDLGYQPAGYYTDRSKAAHWDGCNESGEAVASGVYFYQLRVSSSRSIGAGDYSATRRMVILK